MHHALALGLVTSLVLVVACGDPQRAGGGSSTATPQSPPSSKPSSASFTPPPPGKPAADVLTANPDLATPLSSEWRDKTLAFIEDKPSGLWCPDAAHAKGKDEFESHDAQAAAAKKCREELQAIVELAKKCPVVLEAGSRLEKYDFDAQELPIRLLPESDMLTSDNSRIWWDRTILLSWPGLKPDRLKPRRAFPKDVRCTGGWNDNNTGQSNTSIDLKFNADEVRALKDGIGKVHEDTSFATIQIAVLLDGKTAEEPLACDAVVPKSATGSVLAWRLLSGTCKSTSECVNVPVSPWSTVGRWEPPSSCDELKTALGVAKKNDGGKPMASATPAPSTRPR